MHQKPKYWQGMVTVCDLCQGPFNGVFIDGGTRQGPWACMCEECHANYGRGLGTGYGQKFEKLANGKWLKSEG